MFLENIWANNWIYLHMDDRFKLLCMTSTTSFFIWEVLRDKLVFRSLNKLLNTNLWGCSIYEGSVSNTSLIKLHVLSSHYVIDTRFHLLCVNILQARASLHTRFFGSGLSLVTTSHKSQAGRKTTANKFPNDFMFTMTGEEN